MELLSVTCPGPIAERAPRQTPAREFLVRVRAALVLRRAIAEPQPQPERQKDRAHRAHEDADKRGHLSVAGQGMEHGASTREEWKERGATPTLTRQANWIRLMATA